MNGMFVALVRRVGGLTLFILLLLAIALASMAWALSLLVRGLDLELLLTIVFIGAATGWLLARSRLHSFVALLLTILLAFGIVFVRVGQLGDRFVAVFAALGRVMWDAQFAVFYTAPLLEAVESLRVGILTLLLRLQIWLRALASGQALYEPVALALLWCFVLFLAAAWAAWRLRRAERAFDALLPIILLLAIVTAYAGRDAWAMFVVLGVWLGLMVVVPYRARERQWEREAVGSAEGLGFDLALIAAPAIVGLLVFAIIIPVFSPRAIADWVNTWGQATPATSQMISNSLGIEPAPARRAVTALDRASSPGLPRSHLLGAAPELLQKPALTIQIADAANETNARYWLGTTYDEYTGRGWFSSGFTLQDYPANASAASAPSPAEQVVHQTVKVENFAGLIYAAGRLNRVDQNFQVAWRQRGDMFGAQVTANPYRAESFVPSVDAAALRAAGENYSEWIRSQYLQVPNSVPPRVLALARDLTAAEPTPYDRARAIETYLRAIPYSLDVPEPPRNYDVVDYFLFDLRRGYCDYYATAMAVLARAAGLPARIAVGYAAGAYDSTTRTYHVVEANAHSWTQIYFPEYGWVDFEPTSGQAPLARKATAAMMEPPNSFSNNANILPALAQRTIEQNWLVVPGIILTLGLIALASLIGESLYLRRVSPAKRLTILYQRVLWSARGLELNTLPSYTPQQVNAQFDEFVAAQKNSRLCAWVWQPIPSFLQLVITQYVQATYGAHALTEKENADVLREWERVRVRLALALGINFLRTQIERLLKIRN